VIAGGKFVIFAYMIPFLFRKGNTVPVLELLKVYSRSTS